MGKRFLIRCDVAPSIGTGHLRRCTTLANALTDRNGEVTFLCRAENIDLACELENIANKWKRLEWDTPESEDSRAVVEYCRKWDIDVVVIDHYRASPSYQRILKRNNIRWLQFDWRANFPIVADWILNANAAAEESEYQLVAPNEKTQFLLGPQYALLREDFARLPDRPSYSEQIETIFLSFGGGDDRGTTVRCLKALRGVVPGATRIVLTTSKNRNLEGIQAWAECHPKENVNVIVDTDQMAEHMHSADLALIAGGTTTFEAAAAGLPFLIVRLASNQAPNARAWESAGSAIDLGFLSDLDPESLSGEVQDLANDPERRQKMGERGRKQVDGLGAERVARRLENVMSVESGTR